MNMNEGYKILQSVIFSNMRGYALGYRAAEIFNYDERQWIDGGTELTWGKLVYEAPLSQKQMEGYELKATRTC